MKLCNTTSQIRPNSNDAAGTAVGRPVAAGRSALAVPDDPLESILQCLGAENGFAGDTKGCTAGALFDDFFDGDMDVRMSMCAGAEDFLEMLLDLPVPDTTVLADSTEAAAATRAEAAAVPDRPAVPKLSSTSLSSSEGMDEDDDHHWVSSSDSSSEDDGADAHWLPSKSKKRGGTKRRLQQQQQSTPAGQRKQQAKSVVLPVPHGVVVTAERGGGGIDRWCRHCGTVETPLWRAGPEGAKTLCNACGLRYKNKTSALTTMRRPVLRLVGDATVGRKKRSVAIRVD